jgi:hypothetical protein
MRLLGGPADRSGAAPSHTHFHENQRKNPRNMRTEALVALEPGASFTLKKIDLDDLRPDECLVQMVATGICHTDIKAAAGRSAVKFPVVLGHEGNRLMVPT